MAALATTGATVARAAAEATSSGEPDEELDKDAPTGGPRRIIDSHLHVWSDGSEPFPWEEGLAPAEYLAHEATAEKLVQQMGFATMTGALIVQPIHHKFDHSYVEHVMQTWPGRFKGMCLANPTLSATAAAAQLTAYSKRGFVGVRFNPGLWPEGESMTNKVGCNMFERAGKLNMPVGFMCMDGYDKHAADIEFLMDTYPKTPVVIDHFGFSGTQGGEWKAACWDRLLDLANYPQAHVKVSAMFRNSEFEFPFPDMRDRVTELISIFGANRVLFGSDFPFILRAAPATGLQMGDPPVLGGYHANSRLLFDWNLPVTEQELDMVIGGTAEKLFGKWELDPMPFPEDGSSSEAATIAVDVDAA